MKQSPVPFGLSWVLALMLGAAACGSNNGDSRTEFIGGSNTPPTDAAADASMGGGGMGGSGQIGPVGGSDGASGDLDASLNDDAPIPYCGDGLINRADEKCDDGNNVGGDGCTATCDLEANFVCPTPGMSCVSTVHCGDGHISGPEQCDDANTVSGDGCDATCQVERGWTCEVTGACHPTACGDGIVVGAEQCDDGNAMSGDGCSSTCTLEGPANGERNGWKCPIAGMPCVRTTCGDGVLEGSEQCDDHNVAPFDGCSWNCTKEPTCGYGTAVQTDGGVEAGAAPSGPYSCRAVCGDGILFPGEECDDGNTRDGDGCSNDCHVENGYACNAAPPPAPNPLFMPVVFRDFHPVATTAFPNAAHPQFEISPDPQSRRQPGIASMALGTNGKPVYNPGFIGLALPPANTSLARAWTMDGPARNTAGTVITDAANTQFFSRGAANAASLNVGAIGAAYAQWYTDVTGVNQTFQDLLQVPLIAPGTYQYDRSSSNNDGDPTHKQFFPLDGLGFGSITFAGANSGHNFHFTSEVRDWFQYHGGESLEFRGDDDVWVFINGQLAIDLGGIHGELRGIVTLGSAVDAGGGSVICADEVPCDPNTVNCVDPATIGNCTTSQFNLVPGTIYEIAVFQAERHITASNYKLTLSGFNALRSVCQPICGDGIVVGREQCDLGAANNTGLYGACNPDCTLGPRCGDGAVQTDAGEQCDDGINLTTYGSGCAPGCKIAPFCGDGTVQAPEQCDDGVNAGNYGGCAPGCRYGDRCGDGVLQEEAGEQCDRGPLNGASDCRVDCKFVQLK